jgi:hypothetical protein
MRFEKNTKGWWDTFVTLAAFGAFILLGSWGFKLIVNLIIYLIYGITL